MGTSHVTSMDNLPADILLQIVSRLNLEIILRISLVNRTLNISAKHNQLWRERFRQHFPHVYKTLDAKNISNWYIQFSTTHYAEYPDEKSRKLFPLVKEGRFQEFQEVLQYDDLCLEEKSGMSLPQWISRTKDQLLQDHCYQLCEKHVNSITAGTGMTDTNVSNNLLYFAVCFNQNIDLLIQRGANIHIVYKDGATPLYLAAENGQLDSVNTLIANGANVNAVINFGATALHVAADSGYLEVVNTLIAHGANVNAACESGETPLFLAARNGHLETVNILLAHGANIKIGFLWLNIKTITPQFIANYNGHKETALAIAKQKLCNYLAKTEKQKDDDYKTYSIFGTTFNLSIFGACSAKQNKDAARALKRIYIEGLDESLDAHQDALNQGKLKDIYQDLKSLSADVNKKANSKRLSK